MKHLRTLPFRFFLLALFTFLWACQGQSSAQSVPSPVPAIPAPPPKVHPAFSFTEADFQELLVNLPQEVQEGISRNPKEFLEDYKSLLTQDEFLIRVDKTKALPDGYAPKDLVRLTDYKLTTPHNEVFLRKAIIDKVLEMDAAAMKAGLKLVYTSTYRSYATQVQVYGGWVAKDGKAAADRYSAQPGKSQHQLGTVIDFGDITQEFANTKEGKWLKANAGRFGFSMSFPQGYEKVTGYIWEPWHFRYISPQACLVQDKYFAGIQQYLLEFHDRNKDLLKAAFKG